MKKFIIILISLVIFFCAITFILIPKQLKVSEVVLMNANENAVFRSLSVQKKWIDWWPKTGDKSLSGSSETFKYDEFKYRLKSVLYNAVEIDVSTDRDILNGKINIIRIQPDSVAVRWDTKLITTNNPITRVIDYQKAVRIKRDMSVILHYLKALSEDKDKIYSFNIRRTTLKDSFFVATKIILPNYPSTAVVYNSIERLRTYIKSQRAREVDFPILNITKRDNSEYEMMVAIPTDKILSGQGEITPKRMIIYKDKILTAEVKGGQEIVKKAFDALSIYMTDYNLASPVLPWEMLITDRSKETDSTKWITKIFIPIV